MKSSLKILLLNYGKEYSRHRQGEIYALNQFLIRSFILIEAASVFNSTKLLR